MKAKKRGRFMSFNINKLFILSACALLTACSSGGGGKNTQTSKNVLGLMIADKVEKKSVTWNWACPEVGLSSDETSLLNCQYRYVILTEEENNNLIEPYTFNSDFESGSYQPYSDVKRASQANGDGLYFLYVQYRVLIDDTAPQASQGSFVCGANIPEGKTCNQGESKVFKVQAVLDNTVPLLNISPADGYGPVPAVTWTWSCEHECRYAVTSTNAVPADDASNWSQWSKVESVKKTSVQSSTFYLHVQARDVAKNLVTSSVSASIDPGVQPPPAAPTALSLVNSTSPSENLRPTIKVSGVEGGNIVKLYKDRLCLQEVTSGEVPQGSSFIDFALGEDLGATGTEESIDFFATRAADMSSPSSSCSTASVNYVLDSKPPTLQVIAAQANAQVTWTVSCVDVTGCVDFKYALSQVQAVPEDSNFLAVPDGGEILKQGSRLWYLHLKAKDALDHESATYNKQLLPFVPNVLSLRVPSSSPSNNARPTIGVTGVESSDTVTVYKDAACLMQVGEVVASGAIVEVPVTSDLLAEGEEGSFAFHVNVTLDTAPPITSACSTASVSYSLDRASPTLDVTTPSPTQIGVASWSVSCSDTNSCTSFEYILNELDVRPADNDVEWANVPSDGIISQSDVSGFLNLHLKASDGVGNVSYTKNRQSVSILPPTALALVTPASGPSNNARPSVRVSGLENNDVVKIYKNNTCDMQVGEATASGATVEIPVTSDLLAEGEEGDVVLYAKREAGGESSDCSTAFATYFLDRKAPDISVVSISPNVQLEVTWTVSCLDTNNCVNFRYIVTGESESWTPVPTNNQISYISTDGASRTLQLSAEDSLGNNKMFTSDEVNFVLNPPTALTLITPASSPSSNARPTIQITGVQGGAQSVKLYQDSSCVNEIPLVAHSITQGSDVVNVTPASDLVAEGSYLAFTFYAKKVAASIESSCSTVSLDYVIDRKNPQINITNIVLQPGAQGSIAFNATCSDDTNCDTFRYFLYENETKATSGDSRWLDVPSGGAVDNNTLLNELWLHIRATDQFGNENYETHYHDLRLPQLSELTLINPSNSPSNNARPTVSVSGVFSETAVVNLYSDPSCTT